LPAVGSGSSVEKLFSHGLLVGLHSPLPTNSQPKAVFFITGCSMKDNQKKTDWFETSTDQCPFCKCHNSTVMPGKASNALETFVVICRVCGGRGPEGLNEMTAIILWNGDSGE
jgi:hypothetical protein